VQLLTPKNTERKPPMSVTSPALSATAPFSARPTV
jgi:hypothetical protein